MKTKLLRNGVKILREQGHNGFPIHTKMPAPQCLSASVHFYTVVDILIFISHQRELKAHLHHDVNIIDWTLA